MFFSPLVIPVLLGLGGSALARVARQRPEASSNSTQDLSLGLNHTLDARYVDPTKYVFMHHIVGNTYVYTQSHWEIDIRDIQANSIDALALNIGNDEWQRQSMRYAFAAAQSLNMKLFISFDYTAFACDVDKTLAYMAEFGSNPAYFRYNGKPMVSSYGGSCIGATGWKRIQNAGYYLMPFLWGIEGAMQSTDSNTGYNFLDSWLCWGCAWPQGNYAKNTDDDYYYLGLLGDRYATTVSDWMFTHLPQYADKNFYLRGDDWLGASRWDQVISMRDRLTFVEMVTWNDWGESDYYGNLRWDETQPTGTYWAKDYPHIAFYEMSKYYITAFKTGSWPTITEDVIYFWARPHGRDVGAYNDPIGVKPKGWDWTSDNMWAVVFATSTAKVTISVGSSQNSVTVPAGITKLQVPLSPGRMAVKMERSGQTIINYSPTGYTYTDQAVEKWNYNAYADSARATVSATPTSSSTVTSSASSAAPTSSASGWSSLGCVAEGTTGSHRALTGASYYGSDMTVTKCQSLCTGFAYAAVEYGSECYCGDSYTNNGASGSTISASNCDSQCGGGDSSTKGLCGGSWTFNLYKRGSSSITSSSSSTASSSSSTASSSSSTTSSTVAPTATGWTSVGCVAEGTSGRALTGKSTYKYDLTVAQCQTYCTGFTYAAVEYGSECYCGNSYTNNGASGSVVASSNCNSQCGGGAASTVGQCGGAYMLNLYSFGSGSGSTTTSSSTPAATSSWTNLGCVGEGSAGRALTGASYYDSAMTPTRCTQLCDGFTYAGLEYGSECYCGNSLTNNGATGLNIDSGRCNSPCGGDSSKLCGGAYTMTVYGKAALPASVTSTWTSRGCYSDSTSRMLRGSTLSDSGMTTEKCTGYCSTLGFTMAATQYSNECRCGSQAYYDGGSGNKLSDSQCTSKCAGNSNEACGGAYIQNLYTAPGVTFSKREVVAVKRRHWQNLWGLLI